MAASSRILVRSEYRKLKIPTPWAKKVLRVVLESEKQKGEISLLFVSETRMADLNFAYRKKKGATDVLAFPAQFPSSPLPILGDLVIATPVAAAQAKEAGIPIAHEMAFLLIHGTLHLLGYDHKKSQERRRMFKKQDELFKKMITGKERLGEWN